MCNAISLIVLRWNWTKSEPLKGSEHIDMTGIRLDIICEFPGLIGIEGLKTRMLLVLK